MTHHVLKQMQEMLEGLNLAEVSERTGLSIRTLYRVRDIDGANVTLGTLTRLQDFARTLESTKRLPKALMRRNVGAPRKKRQRDPPGETRFIAVL